MNESKAPRMTPLPENQWTDEMRGMFEPTIKTFGRVFNIFTTLGRHPKLLKLLLLTHSVKEFFICFCSQHSFLHKLHCFFNLHII